jgi:hypothetical protein
MQKEQESCLRAKFIVFFVCQRPAMEIKSERARVRKDFFWHIAPQHLV